MIHHLYRQKSPKQGLLFLVKMVVLAAKSTTIMTISSVLNKEINMKKLIVAALVLVGLGAVVTFVAKNLDN